MIGRTRDVRRLRAYLDGGPGRGLHVVGEPGVGKTTLLTAVAEAVTETGTQVLSADGVEFEADVAYSGLHQILTPVLDHAAELHPDHRQALDVALGFGTGPAPNRLLLVNATLALLRAAAAARPVLLIVDDLPWVDHASAVILGFVARRLPGDRIGFLAASRTSSASVLDRGGVAEYALAPLDDDSAHLLLRARYPQLADRVRNRVVTEARGNPLALLDLPTELTPGQQTAAEELPSVLALGKRTRPLYGSRVAALPVVGRRMLLLAALADTADPSILRAAASARHPGTEPLSAADALAGLLTAEQNRLIHIDHGARQIVFCHPLIRSAAVDASTLSERRSAHLALADASSDRPDVRAWHLAEAATDPDEDIAQRLQEAANSGLLRGDTVGAVAGLIRAADLSPDPVNRSRRLAHAAYVSAETSGDIGMASDLLRRAQGALGTLPASAESGALHAAAAAVYVLLDGDADLDTVHRMLIGAIEAAGPDYDAEDPALVDALHTLQWVCWWSGREEAWKPLLETVNKIRPSAPPILKLAAQTLPDPAHAALPSSQEVDAVQELLRGTVSPTTLLRGASATFYLDRVRDIRDRLQALIGSEGRDSSLSRHHIGALLHLCTDDFLSGEWEEAQQLAKEGLAVCEARYPSFAWYFQYTQVLLHGARGETDAGNALAEEIVRWATPRGVEAAVMFAHQARTLVCLSSGDFEAAYHHATALTPAGTLAPYRPHALWGVYDLVEAAMRTGRVREARAHVDALRELPLGRLSERSSLLVTGASALVAPDEAAITHFRTALATPRTDRWPFEASRVRLALGERLRRMGARAEAGEELTTAAATFTRLGATPWSERTSKELRAIGIGTTPVTENTPLTPQELEIAQLAATGLTNKQIAQRLYLSHRTVGSHLYRLFPKLGIRKRAALRDALTALDGRPFTYHSSPFDGIRPTD